MANLNDSTVNTLSLLDAKLEDLADLPEWVLFPAGVFEVKPSVKTETKVNGKTKTKETIVTIGAKLLSIKELADPASAKPEPGAETSVRFTWEHEYGRGALKRLLKPIAEVTKVSKVSQLLEILNTADSVLIVMDIREAEVKGQTRNYQQFTDLIVS